MKFSWDWLSTNLPNIFKALWKGLFDLLIVVVNGIFDALDAVVSLLPSGSLVPSFSLPPNAEWVLNGLNYFFDVTAIATTIGLVIGTHIALAAVVAALRFAQVMK